MDTDQMDDTKTRGKRRRNEKKEKRDAMGEEKSKNATVERMSKKKKNAPKEYTDGTVANYGMLE